jgi:CheY-like chemotaxis protein
MLLDLNMPRMNGLELCMALRGAGLAASCEKTPAISRTIVDLMQTSRRRWLTAAAG